MKTRLFGGAMIALGAIVFNGVPALAQGTTTASATQTKHQKGDREGHGHFAKVLKELNLTDQQKAALKPILKESRAQGKAIREDTKLTPEQKRDKVKDLMKATHEKIAGILTPEQKTKLKDLRGAHHKKGA